MPLWPEALCPQANASDVYLYVLRSRTIADDLIDQFSLMNVYKQKTRTFTEDKLRENTQLTSGKEGGITISVDDRDPNRAAELANGYVDDLKKLTKTLAMTEAGAAASSSRMRCRRPWMTSPRLNSA